MAQVISGEVQCSSYIVARAVIDYSGTSATANIQYRHTYGGYTGYNGSFTYGAGGSSASGRWVNETVSTSWTTKMSIGFSISMSGGSYRVWCSGYDYNDFSLNVSIPAQIVAPSGGSASLVSKTHNSVVAKASISSFGIPSGENNRYSEVGILPAGSGNYDDRYAYQATYRSTSTGNKTFTHSNLKGCAGFRVGWYATNTRATSKGVNGTNYYLPPAPLATLSLNTKTKNTTNESCKINIKGGSNVSGAKVYVDYRYKSGANGSWSGWNTCATNVSPDATQTPTFTAPYDQTIYVEARQRRYNTGETSDVKSFNFATDTTYTLQLKETLDGGSETTASHYKANVVVNNTTVATDVSNWSGKYPSGLSYSVTVTANDGYMLLVNNEWKASYTFTGTTSTSTTTVSPAVYTKTPPVFTNFGYSDENSATLAITGDDQYLISGYSQAKLTILSTDKAVAQNSAEMSSYVYSGLFNGTEPYSDNDVEVSMGTTPGGLTADSTLTVSAYDNRGVKTSVSKTLLIIPHADPVLTVKAERQNDFEDNTTIKTSGSISRLAVNDVMKNDVTAFRSRYRIVEGSWSQWTNITYSLDSATGKVTGTNFVRQLDNTDQWEVQVELTDKLATTTSTILVDRGIPIFRISTYDNELYHREHRILDEEDISSILLAIYPVGSIYMSVNNTNPSTLFGGTWVAWGEGRVPVGVDANDSNFNYAERTGGSATHAHDFKVGFVRYYGAFTGGENADLNTWGAWSYAQNKYGKDAGIELRQEHARNSALTNSLTTFTDDTKYTVGDTKTESSYQPYVTCYMWKRTA